MWVLLKERPQRGGDFFRSELMPSASKIECNFSQTEMGGEGGRGTYGPILIAYRNFKVILEICPYVF